MDVFYGLKRIVFFFCSEEIVFVFLFVFLHCLESLVIACCARQVKRGSEREREKRKRKPERKREETDCKHCPIRGRQVKH